jgi:hypothetical protein
MWFLNSKCKTQNSKLKGEINAKEGDGGDRKRTVSRFGAVFFNFSQKAIFYLFKYILINLNNIQ